MPGRFSMNHALLFMFDGTAELAEDAGALAATLKA